MRSRKNKPPKNKLAKTEKQPKTTKGYFVLFIGDDGAVLVYYQNNQVLRRLFATAHNDKTSEALVDLLQEFPQSPIFVLVDLLDQAYVRHSLPPVTSLGVNKIIQRRLSRDFAATDLKGAISLGREKKGRKDWNFLLISVSYNNRLQGWLELIYDLPNRLMGIYLAPVEAEMVLQSLKAADGNLSKDNKTKPKLSKTLSPNSLSPKTLSLGKAKTLNTNDITPPKWDILVLHNKTGGFRQVVLKDNKLVFTRMAQCNPNVKPSVMAGNVEQEVKNTIEYLKRLAFSQGSELNIIIIIGDDIKANISTTIFNAKTCVIHTPHEAATLLKIDSAVLSGDKFTDVFLSCAFLQYKKHRLKLMSDHIKKTERLYSIISLTKIAASIAIFGLLGLCAYDGYQGFTVTSQLHQKQQEVKSIANRAYDFSEQTGKFAVDPLKIDALMKINDLISAKTNDYHELIIGISQNISQVAHVKNFEWVNNNIAKTSKIAQGAAVAVAPANSFEAKIEWELTVKEKEEKQLKIIWNGLQQDLQKSLQTYEISDEGIEGMGEAEDKLTINFTQKSQANNTGIAEKTLIAKMKITPAKIATQMQQLQAQPQTQQQPMTAP